MNWLRLFFILAVSIFLISIIAYVWVDRLISTQSFRTAESKHSDAPKAEVRFARNTYAQQKTVVTNEGPLLEQSVTASNDELKSIQPQSDSSLMQDSIESKHEVSQIQPAPPSERELLLTKMAQRLEWLSEHIKRLEDEEAALPSPPQREYPTTITLEEMERENEIAKQRYELTLRAAELGKEYFYLNRDFKALQQE